VGNNPSQKTQTFPRFLERLRQGGNDHIGGTLLPQRFHSLHDFYLDRGCPSVERGFSFLSHPCGLLTPVRQMVAAGHLDPEKILLENYSGITAGH
jgi:hypothetical protein